MNEPPAFPTDIEHVPIGEEPDNAISTGEGGVPVEIEHPVSATLNPEPEIVTVPALAMVGDNEI